MKTATATMNIRKNVFIVRGVKDWNELGPQP